MACSSARRNSVLEQVAARPCLQRGKDGLVIVGHCQHEHANVWTGTQELLSVRNWDTMSHSCPSTGTSRLSTIMTRVSHRWDAGTGMLAPST